MSMYGTLRKKLAQVLTLFAALTVLTVPVSVIHAQIGNTSIARTYTVEGTQPVSGDLVSFDRDKQSLHLTESLNDTTLFGVVVDRPVIVLRSTEAGVPIISSGEVSVNVTALGGPIQAGDYITTSTEPGKGQKASASDAFVVGTALESFGTASSSPTTSGTIAVHLSIGSRPADGSTTTDAYTSSVTTSKSTGITVPVVFKYLLAALVAIGSITISFRSFGSSIKESIVSVGRNPLAKNSIQSMVVLNTFLIVLVSAAGLFVAFAILFLPI